MYKKAISEVLITFYKVNYKNISYSYRIKIIYSKKYIKIKIYLWFI